MKLDSINGNKDVKTRHCMFNELIEGGDALRYGMLCPFVGKAMFKDGHKDYLPANVTMFKALDLYSYACSGGNGFIAVLRNCIEPDHPGAEYRMYTTSSFKHEFKNAYREWLAAETDVDVSHPLSQDALNRQASVVTELVKMGYSWITQNDHNRCPSVYKMSSYDSADYFKPMTANPNYGFKLDFDVLRTILHKEILSRLLPLEGSVFDAKVTPIA